MCLPQVIKSFQNYRGVATTFYPTLVLQYMTEIWRALVVTKCTCFILIKFVYTFVITSKILWFVWYSKIPSVK